MKNKLLDEARELLNKAEKITDPRPKKALCERALELFDEILENEQEDEIALINNIKKSFARSLVHQISTMNMGDVETAEFHYFNFILKFPKEVIELMDENPVFDERIKWLGKQFSHFIE